MPDNTPGLVEQVTDPGLTSLHVETEQLLTLIEGLRRVQALGPTSPPSGLDDAGLGRHLAYETITTVTRNEAVMRTVVVILSSVATEMIRRNELRATEIEDRRAARADAVLARDDNRAREALRRGYIERIVGPIGVWAGNLLSDERVRTSLIGALCGVLGSSAAWGPALFHWLAGP